MSGKKSDTIWFGDEPHNVRPPVNALSSEPAERARQLSALVTAGWLSESEAARMLAIPDAQKADLR